MQENSCSQAKIVCLTKETDGKICCAFNGTERCHTYNGIPSCFECKIMKLMMLKLNMLESIEKEMAEK